jgi:hypothetical protein
MMRLLKHSQSITGLTQISDDTLASSSLDGSVSSAGQLPLVAVRLPGGCTSSVCCSAHITVRPVFYQFLLTPWIASSEAPHNNCWCLAPAAVDFPAYLI